MMRNESRIGRLYFSLLLLIAGALFVRPDTAAAENEIAGVWACQSISGGAYTGRACRTEPWLKLEAENSYAWGRETGKWLFANKVLTLSKRKGNGHLDADGKLIYEYDMNGKHYVMTLYKRTL